MASSPHTERKEAGDDPVNIQLGIFVPPQTTKIRKRPKQPRTSVEPESNKSDQENNRTNAETNGKTRGKRKRLDSTESVDDETPSTPGAKRLENNTESEETSGKVKRKRKKRKKKRQPTKEEPSVSNGGATEKERALEYLTSWDSGSSGWTFRKKIQYWLLQNAYDRHKVSLWIKRNTKHILSSKLILSHLTNPCVHVL